MNIFSFVYLAVFLLAGFCIARRALPQAGLSVSIPLGCGFGVSLLAFVPACFAVVLGFRLPALLLAVAVVAALAVWLARHGTPFTRVPDPDAAALWACVLPLAVVTLYLLHTHVLHLVDGSYHTGQSCYGDMAMHLGFIKNIAVTGKLPPVYPLCWAARAKLAWLFGCSLWAAGSGLCISLAAPRRLPASLPGFTPPPPTTLPKTLSGSTPSWIC